MTTRFADRRPQQQTALPQQRSRRPGIGRRSGRRAAALLAACAVWLGTAGRPSVLPAAALQLRPDDHICLVGNGLGERMQHHNWWETLLYQRFPKHRLVVRNLCFPGDEPYFRLRSLNFGEPDEHLRHSQATVILYFFGGNEAFSGARGLEKFRADMLRLVRETLQKDYSGKGPPRIVLISPIARENLHDPNIDDGREHNKWLARYTDVLRDVAAKTGVGFVDLFTPTRLLFENSDERFTINSYHLSDFGYRNLAPILDVGLFGSEQEQPRDFRAVRRLVDAARFDAKLRAAIADKNFHWWHRYRAVNGYYIYGGRANAGFDGTYRNRDVMERERQILDQMCANRDRRIWKIAQGQPVPPKVDDSNTLPFIVPKSNVDDPNDPNRRAGKLGSLNYLPAREQQKLFHLPDGYEIQLVASEEDFPELANPVAINFDNKGRLWVSVMPSYPQWQPKTKLDDKLLILEDLDGDGHADQCKTFAGGLHVPTGFEFGKGGVFVAQQPDILFLKDTDGDDQADVRVRQLIGFDSLDTHHGISAFEWGPGGGLYFCEGTFKQSQVESAYGVRRLSDAGVWRYEPRTEKFDVFISFKFANPWGHVFDRWGQSFVSDASPGNNYFATPISGRVIYPDKHPGGRLARNEPQYPTFILKRVRPSSGCEFVSSRNFPPEAQGNFLVNNVIGFRGVLQHRVSERGSGFVGVEIEPLVTCDDGNFRPVDLQFGPDGALYICDWHNALIGHLQHNLRDPNRDHTHGRIWRVVYTGRPLLTPPKIAGATVRELLDLLKEPEDRTRYRARRELFDRDTAEVITTLEAWIDELDPKDPNYEHHLLEALWLHQAHNVVNEALLKRVLNSPEPRARAAATRVLSYWLDRVPDALELLEDAVRDEHPRVRLEAVRACSFLDIPEGIEIALEVLNRPMDYYLDYTLNETIRTVEKVLRMKRGGSTASPQHVHAGHASGVGGPPPLVFLDKSPAIVEFQLKRLSNDELLRIPRDAKDPKFIPVHRAILTRPGTTRQQRLEAAQALAALQKRDVLEVLLDAVATVASGPVPKDRAAAATRQATLRDLAELVLDRPTEELAAHLSLFERRLDADVPFVRQLALAALATAAGPEATWRRVSGDQTRTVDLLEAVALIRRADVRTGLRQPVHELVTRGRVARPVRKAAIRALAEIPARETENFRAIAAHLDDPALRVTAARALLRIPTDAWPKEDAERILQRLIAYGRSVPLKKRTTDEFLDVMLLADRLVALLPVEAARKYREQLGDIAVRVIRINTVYEEMRYDTPYFAVQAGKPVQIILRNNDIMPHNLVITRPGAMREIGMMASTMKPEEGKPPYVPRSKKVLWATPMLPPGGVARLTFTAPKKPGEYPYVCTFPNHWFRMYGVMVVTEDLAAWQANPVPPADPLGLSRKLVKHWTLDDFRDVIAQGHWQRDHATGLRLFNEATCIKCHKIAGQGAAVGPDLTEVFKRHKGNRLSVLTEMLDPSRRIDEKYAVYSIITKKGQVISGIITSQDDHTLTLVANPEKPQPQVIRKSDIDEMIRTNTSLMPKGLLDRFTKEEILQILSFLEAGGSPEHPVYGSTPAGH
ncbi:MAG: azurin [Planctomycetota bacterium]|nr:MAG: azurin [Planctomycetota bacterium]